MKVKSLLAAGTMVAGLGVSVFSLPTYAASTTLNDISGLTCADDGIGNNACVLPAGDYVLGADLNLGDAYLSVSSAVTIDLNGHKISTTSWWAAMQVINGTLTINGNGEIGNTVRIKAGSNVTINGGTFKSGITAIYVDDKLTDGNVGNPTTLIVNNGSFVAEGDNGIEATFDNANSKLTISGGTFTGGYAGLVVNKVDQVKLLGGTYSFTGDYGFGSIAATGDKSGFSKMLGDGYEYSGTDFAGDATMSAIKTSPLTVRAKATTPSTPSTPSTPTTPTTENKTTEKVIAKATSTGSTKKAITKVKAPNSGAVEGAVATGGLTILTIATLAGLAFLKKMF